MTSSSTCFSIYESSSSRVRIRDEQLNVDVERVFSAPLPFVAKTKKEWEHGGVSDGICELYSNKLKNLNLARSTLEILDHRNSPGCIQGDGDGLLARDVGEDKTNSSTCLSIRTDKDNLLVERWMCHEGMKQGCFQCFFPSGILAAERWYVDDCLWGRALDYFPEGSLKAQYGYKNGQLHGAWRVWRQDGSLQIKGMYVDGLPHGSFELRDKEGAFQRQTHFERGRRNGADAGFSEDGYLLFLDMWDQGLRQKNGFIDCIERYLKSEIVER